MKMERGKTKGRVILRESSRLVGIGTTEESKPGVKLPGLDAVENHYTGIHGFA